MFMTSAEAAKKYGPFFFYMKIGGHCGETLEQIIERKQKEIADCGYCLWGFGGKNNLIMQAIGNFVSFFAFVKQEHVPVFFEVVKHDCSKSGLSIKQPANEITNIGEEEIWEKIPSCIRVTGSKHALWIDELRAEKFSLDQNDCTVFISDSASTEELLTMGEAMRGRKDKCIGNFGAEWKSKVDRKLNYKVEANISWVGRLKYPFASDVR